VSNAGAIEVAGLHKTFRLPREQSNTIKERFLHPLRRTLYEENQALRDVTFTIRQGEFFGIIGPNGSGKSTLLKILAGIYQPSGGDVRIDGDVSPFIELGVGFNRELNARDNVRVNGTLLGMTRAELDGRFDDIIRFAELERFVHEKLKNYSSGMQVRLAFSIAVQVVFDILLLDEVLAVGDRAFQEKCYASFEGMRNEGKTIILVSHDLDAVASFCDRALFLHNGLVESIGPADEIVAEYARLVPVS
jgi:ABC-type polysaccharide/polyol phosphate transport system ATPase subunit